MRNYDQNVGFCFGKIGPNRRNRGGRNNMGGGAVGVPAFVDESFSADFGKIQLTT